MIISERLKNRFFRNGIEDRVGALVAARCWEMVVRPRKTPPRVSPSGCPPYTHDQPRKSPMRTLAPRLAPQI